MTDKGRLTRKQHETIGSELQWMRTKLGDLATELGRIYPSEVAALAEDALQAVDALRQELSERVKSEAAASVTADKTYFRGNDAIDDVKRKIEHTRYLLSLPIDFEQLEREGLLIKDGDKYRAPDLSKLPEQVLHRIKFLEQEDNVTFLTLNEKGL